MRSLLRLRIPPWLLLLLSVAVAVHAAPRRPNIVVLLADDLGYGDVGCFGNTTISTPNIDRLAQNGAVLTHHTAAAAVCTPSRAALLTGRYPVRSGMESYFKNKVFIIVASSGGLPANETTFAKVLQQQGYSTGYIGKWHLGLYCTSKEDPCHHPSRHGFEFFYGLPLTNLKDFGDDDGSVVTTYFPNIFRFCYTAMTLSAAFSLLLFRSGRPIAAAFVFVLFFVDPAVIVFFIKSIPTLNGVVMRNFDVVEQPVRLPGMTQRLVAESQRFVRSAVAEGKPFLLFLSFIHVHTALFSHPFFIGKSAHGRYGDNVEELDWAIGKVTELLQETDQTNNTFVYFTSDNGAHVQEIGIRGEREGGYNGIFRGGKTMGGWEGGIRVPTVVSWPGHVPSGLKIEASTSQLDMMPTLLAVAGAKTPQDRVIDGSNILPLLRKETAAASHEFLFHYCGIHIHAVRYTPRDGSGTWKVHFMSPDPALCTYVCHCYGSYVLRHDPPLVFHLDFDPSESRPLREQDDPRVARVREAVAEAVAEHEASLQLVPQQFDFFHSVWRPWLQPCCSYQFCSCRENYTLTDTL
ncbi:steryl-sulfatase-like [Rhipicephalus microplus]|uniref:steryl-sulfatase-like n=1 Tax=Rhipicephalus microplus TaxID=6941 RepID=UPI003F6AD281